MVDCNIVISPIEVNLKVVKYENYKHVNNMNYKQNMGSLRFVCDRISYICFLVELVANTVDLKVIHVALVKRILKYLKGTTEYGFFFPKDRKDKLVGFCDSDQCEDKENRNYCLFFQVSRCTNLLIF